VLGFARQGFPRRLRRYARVYDSDLDGIVGDFEPQLRLEERTRRLRLVDVTEDLGRRGGARVQGRARRRSQAEDRGCNQGRGQTSGEARAEREGNGEGGLQENRRAQTSSVFVPYTLGPMPQFPRQPQLLMRAVVSDSVAHSSGSVCPTDMLHRAAVLARDRSSLSVSCEPAFLQALFVQTDIDPGSPRESAVACLAKSGRVRRTRTATHGAMLRRALIKSSLNFKTCTRD